MIDSKTVLDVAKLARLSLNEKEAQDLTDQLSKALTYFDQISKVHTQGVEPLITPVEIEMSWREDKVKSADTAEDILKNAPERTGNLFTVPPVI